MKNIDLQHIRAAVNSLPLGVQRKSLATFGYSNKKLARNGTESLTFSLPAGYSCPSAMDCKSKSHRLTGKIKDGAQTKFRCFAASMESRQPSVRLSRWRNYDKLRKLKTSESIATFLASSLLVNAEYRKGKITHVRVHVSGDFYNLEYFKAWQKVALMFPDLLFYAYTKQLPFLLESIAGNFRLVASRGGTHDALIDLHQFREARVVYSIAEAQTLDLEIDHNDSSAFQGSKSFALLIHGTQPKK